MNENWGDLEIIEEEDQIKMKAEREGWRLMSIRIELGFSPVYIFLLHILIDLIKSFIF